MKPFRWRLSHLTTNCTNICIYISLSQVGYIVRKMSLRIIVPVGHAVERHLMNTLSGPVHFYLRQNTITGRVLILYPRNETKGLMRKYSLMRPHEHLIWTVTWQNKQNECASSEDSDPPGHKSYICLMLSFSSKWRGSSCSWGQFQHLPFTHNNQ